MYFYDLYIIEFYPAYKDYIKKIRNLKDHTHTNLNICLKIN